MGLSPAQQLALADDEARRLILSAFSDEELERLEYEWRFWARPEQLLPAGSWYLWLILAGRGWGKTRTGSEAVIRWAQEQPGCRIALVARTAADYRGTMVEGESGILECSPPDFYPLYEPSKRKLTWPNGSIAITYSADEPKLLRGPQHHKAWCDELAAWEHEGGKLRDDDPDSPWNNLVLGLRLGNEPQVVVTTTPRPTPRIKQLARRRNTVITSGNTDENVANVAKAFLEEIQIYRGTRLERQEIYGQILDDVPGALWKRDFYQHKPVDLESLRKIVVAIDPAVTSKKATSDETGIVAAGINKAKKAWILDDRSGIYKPREWARTALELAWEINADEIIGEGNNGGEMVEEVLRGALHEGETMPPYEMVWASRGKRTRAEPVAIRYEGGDVYHARVFTELEDQQCNWDPSVDDDSPDRLDASVWALSRLMLGDKSRKITDSTREKLQRAGLYG